MRRPHARCRSLPAEGTLSGFGRPGATEASSTVRLARWLAAAGLAGIALSAAAAADNPARARVQYMHHCAGCHLADGAGAPDVGIPSMRGQLGQFLGVAGGREFIVQVPGVMNSPLSDADIANLMNWLLPTVTAATLPPGIAPYSTEEITRLRGSRPVDVMAVRAALVAKMPAPASARP